MGIKQESMNDLTELLVEIALIVFIVEKTLEIIRKG